MKQPVAQLALPCSRINICALLALLQDCPQVEVDQEKLTLTLVGSVGETVSCTEPFAGAESCAAAGVVGVQPEGGAVQPEQSE